MENVLALQEIIVEDTTPTHDCPRSSGLSAGCACSC
jgi:hypothetical protein